MIEGRQPQAPSPITINNNNEWEVKEILHCWMHGQQRQYLVSWKGFGPQENSWEPVGNLESCKELLYQFNKQFLSACYYLETSLHRAKYTKNRNKINIS